MATKQTPSLDTNVLLRLIVRDNAQMLEKARKLLDEHEVFAVADQAIIEIVYVLGGHYGYSRHEVADVVKALIDNQHLNLNRPLFERVLPHYRKHSSLSFTDCCLEAYATLNQQTPLYTFDTKLAKQLTGARLID